MQIEEDANDPENRQYAEEAISRQREMNQRYA